MTIRAVGRSAAAFLLATVATALLASIVQTQVNLAALAVLGAPISGSVRVTTTLEDIAFFGPVMAAIAAAAFLPAFAVASLASRLVPVSRVAMHALAGAAGLAAAFWIMGFFTPMPNLIAALRTATGFLSVCATGFVGGAVFAAASRPVNLRRATLRSSGA